jgi:hypothetical protein
MARAEFPMAVSLLFFLIRMEGVVYSWVNSARRPLTSLMFLPPGDYDDGEFGWMKIGKGNRSTRRKPAPAPICPPQMPLDQIMVRTRAAAMGSQRLTAWAMAGPRVATYSSYKLFPEGCMGTAQKKRQTQTRRRKEDTMLNKCSLHLTGNLVNIFSKITDSPQPLLSIPNQNLAVCIDFQECIWLSEISTRLSVDCSTHIERDLLQYRLVYSLLNVSLLGW